MARVDSVARVPRERGQSLASVYVATFVIAAGNGVVFPLLADLQDEHGLPTYGLSIVSMVLFALSNDLWQFTFARALSGLAFGCFAPATRSIVARLDADNVG